MLSKSAFILLAVVLVLGLTAVAIADCPYQLGKGNGSGQGQGQGPQFRHGGDKGQGQGHQGQGNPNCPGDRIEGVITEINTAAMTLVVETDAGFVAVQADADTVVKMGRTALEFEDLEVGQTIAACGELDGDMLLASMINVKYRGKIL